MAVLFLALASFFYSVQFYFNKKYQLRTDGSMNAAFWFLLSSSLTMVVVTAPFAAVSFNPDRAALLIALGNAFFFAGSLLISIPAMKLGSLAAFSVFFLTGSIVIPFVYGVFWLDESITAPKIAGILIVLASLLPDVAASAMAKKKNPDNVSGKRPLFLVLCFAGFLTNGFGTILVKMLFVYSPGADNATFIFLSALFRTIGIIPVILIAASIKTLNSRSASRSFGSALFSGVGENAAAMSVLGACLMGALYAASNMSGTVFSLECAKIMDSSVQFPVMNAAIIIGSTLISIIFMHEKPRWNNYAGVALALFGIIVYSL
jgi:drug/metabolite transporter (DMT)-like permease